MKIIATGTIQVSKKNRQQNLMEHAVRLRDTKRERKERGAEIPDRNEQSRRQERREK
jgi:hypothetical protein